VARRATARDHPAEHEEAGRLALRVLRAAGLTWRDVLPIGPPLVVSSAWE